MKTHHRDKSLGGRFRLSDQDVKKIEERIEICPFCRTKESSISESEEVKRQMKRAELGIADDIIHSRLLLSSREPWIEEGRG